MEKFMICFGRIPFLVAQVQRKAGQRTSSKGSRIAYLKSIPKMAFPQKSRRNPLLNINHPP
jgi:hypothetical protein